MKTKKAKRHIVEINQENDIKFRGKLSYRHFRILGWVFLAVAQFAVILNMHAKLSNSPNMYGALPNVLSFFSNLMAPLFLIAAFSIILVAKDGYRRLIISYTGCTILAFVGFVLIYSHYLSGFLTAFVGAEGKDLFLELIMLGIAPFGFFPFNIFIDLLLCTLVTFFINYKPKKYFVGKKLIYFRLFVILPILYEIVSIILKILTGVGVITLHPLLFPLLTTKSPVAFLIFLALSIFVKVRERIFLKKGKTHEDFKAFQDTNANRLHFNIFLSITIGVGVILDILLLVLLTVIFSVNADVPPDVTEVEVVTQKMQLVYALGFGQAIPLLFIIPLVMFFDYRKTYKNKLPDLLIPAIGVGLLVVVYVEGVFQVLTSWINSVESETESEDTSLLAGISMISRGILK